MFFDSSQAVMLERARQLLLDGEVIAVPTDTVYGLVALADDESAVRRIFELKRRPGEVRIAVLVAGTAQAAGLVEFSARARRLVERFWPGPLTVVARRRPGVSPAVGDEATLGVRCPDDGLLRRLAGLGPLAATSANRHGAHPQSTARAVARDLPDLRQVFDGGERLHGLASTVVDVTGPDPLVLRAGPISEADLTAVWECPRHLQPRESRDGPGSLDP